MQFSWGAALSAMEKLGKEKVFLQLLSLGDGKLQNVDFLLSFFFGCITNPDQIDFNIYLIVLNMSDN